jgi:PleD family two-component response regulator
MQEEMGGRMSKGLILIVEDEFDIANMLRIYLKSHGYETIIAPRGEEALEMCRRQLPNLVFLDIMLPDIDGYETLRRLRSNLRTSHLPVIFLTQKSQRSDQIAGLKMGADDYITKPFDLQILLLRMENALRRASWLNLSNAVTGLPSSKLIEEQLRKIIHRDGWALLYIGINHISEFKDVCGFVAGDDVLRLAAMLMSEIADEVGSGADFLGHIGGDDFVIITTPEVAPHIRGRLVSRFNQEVQTFYSFMDRERGYLEVAAGEGEVYKSPLMTLAVGTVFHNSASFTSIHDLTELAAEARRGARPSEAKPDGAAPASAQT